MGVPERRQRGKVERREEILAAAERVFVRKGIMSSTMEDIAREAELSKGALYLYFQSKDELFLTIAIRALTEFEARYREAVTSPANESGFIALEAGLRDYVRFAKDQRERFQAAMSWTSVEYPVDGDSPLFSEYRELITKVFTLATSVVVRGQEDGSVRSDIAADRISMHLWGATMGMLAFDDNEQIRRRVDSAPDVNDLAPEFVDLVLAGVRTDGVRDIAPKSRRAPKSDAPRD